MKPGATLVVLALAIACGPSAVPATAVPSPGSTAAATPEAAHEPPPNNVPATTPVPGQSAPDPGGMLPAPGPRLVPPTPGDPCRATASITLADTDDRGRHLTIARKVTGWTLEWTQAKLTDPDTGLCPPPLDRKSLLALGGRERGDVIEFAPAEDLQRFDYRFDSLGRAVQIDIDPVDDDDAYRYVFEYTCREPIPPRKTELIEISIWRRGIRVDARGNETAPWITAEPSGFVARAPRLGGKTRLLLPGGRASLEREIVEIRTLVMGGVLVKLEPSTDMVRFGGPADADRSESLPFDGIAIYPDTAYPRATLLDRATLGSRLPADPEAIYAAIDLDGDGSADQIRAHTHPERELGCTTTFDRRGSAWRARAESCGD